MSEETERPRPTDCLSCPICGWFGVRADIVLDEDACPVCSGTVQAWLLDTRDATDGRVGS